jgi:hypothetical protein
MAWLDAFLTRVGTNFTDVVSGMCKDATHRLCDYVARQTDERVRFGRFESLREDAVRLLTEAGYPPPAGLLHSIRQRPAENASQHGHYRELYTSALRDLVAQAEAPIIERFGYEF